MVFYVLWPHIGRPLAFILDQWLIHALISSDLHSKGEGLPVFHAWVSTWDSEDCGQKEIQGAHACGPRHHHQQPPCIDGAVPQARGPCLVSAWPEDRWVSRVPFTLVCNHAITVYVFYLRLLMPCIVCFFWGVGLVSFPLSSLSGCTTQLQAQ